MLIYEITTPGTWLDYEDHEWTHEIDSLLYGLKSQFYDANIALNLFLSDREISRKHVHGTDWEANHQRKMELRTLVEQELGRPSHDGWEDVSFEVDLRFKREKWASGQVPREFEHGLPFIHARAFLQALDMFGKLLKVLSEQPNVPVPLKDFPQQFDAAFPHLRAVRNSVQHLEDRSRGLGAGSKPKPLDLQPITNSMIHAPQGNVLALNNLNGSRYGCTMADGHYGEVDVSAESMEIIQKLLQGTLDAFKWRGTKHHQPGA